MVAETIRMERDSQVTMSGLDRQESKLDRAIERARELMDSYGIEQKGEFNLTEALFREYLAEFESRLVDCQRYVMTDIRAEMHSFYYKQIQEWEKSGRKSPWTPETLLNENYKKDVAAACLRDWGGELQTLNHLHTSIIHYAMTSSGLADRLIEDAKETGNKFGLVELTARLSPTMSFAGSSAWFAGSLGPYSKEAREGLGEEHSGRGYVNAETAQESAMNALEKLGAKNVLAETSSAPRPDVAKSGRGPELYICTIVNGSTPEVTKYDQSDEVLGSQFRSIYDARARELMFQHLNKMYEVGGWS